MSRPSRYRPARLVLLGLATALVALPACTDEGGTPAERPDAHTEEPTPDAGPVDQRPSVTFVTPQASDALRETTRVIVDPGDDEGVVLVQLFLDHQLIDEKKFAPYVFDVDTRAWPEGAHELRALAHDTHDQRQSATQSIFFDNTPPSIQFSGVTSSETPTKAMFTVSDNIGVVKVEAMGPIGGLKTAPPFEFAFDGGCFSGSESVTVTDRAGWTTTIYPSFSIVDSCDRDCDLARRAGCGGADCDDSDAFVHPGQLDGEFDGIDADCDGTDATDLDHDGVPLGPDCNDGNAGVHGAVFRWTDEPTPLALTGGLADLALAGDAPSVCGVMGFPFRVECAHRTGTTWSRETVTEGTDQRAGYLGLSADASSATIVAAFDAQNHLGIFARQQGSWSEVASDSRQLVDDGSLTRSLSVARDAAGHTHIVYQAYTPFFERELRYATDASGEWTFESVGFIAYDSSFLPTVLTSPAGVPHAIYSVNEGGSNVAVARRTPSGWERLPVISNDLAALATGAFDPSGTLHVLSGPRFGTQEHSTFDGQTWSHESVPPTSNVYVSWYSLVCDSPSSCALLGRGSSPPFYAARIGGKWYGNSVLGSVYSNSPLVLDAGNHPHAVFVRPGDAVTFGSLAPTSVLPANDPAGDGVDRDCDGVD